jgi:hypothetical protein
VPFVLEVAVPRELSSLAADEVTVLKEGKVSAPAGHDSAGASERSTGNRLHGEE